MPANKNANGSMMPFTMACAFDLALGLSGCMTVKKTGLVIVVRNTSIAMAAAPNA